MLNFCRCESSTGSGCHARCATIALQMVSLIDRPDPTGVLVSVINYYLLKHLKTLQKFTLIYLNLIINLLFCFVIRVLAISV